MDEFTGERVIPGEVDVDLLNEHLARYAFAARRARGRRVLDAGCGVGYGAAQLAQVARSVAGLEIAPDVVRSARARYPAPRLHFVCGDCRALPFASASLDLVVAFEVIEHLDHWEEMLDETRRVLSPQGELIISTPNRLYYSESRETPNPFHVHEFDYQEFCGALGARFPNVRMFLENHSEGVIFSLPEATNIESFVESGAGSGPVDPNASHFFVAVCSRQPIYSSPPFIYIPQSGNVLREREKHIALLETELEQKDRWLTQAKEDLADLHRKHQALEEEAAEAQRRAQETIDDLEQENARKTEWSRQLEAEVARLGGVIGQLQVELSEKTQWALNLEAERAQIFANYQRLDAEAVQLRLDLKAAVDQLHATEAELAERTAWAQGLDQEVARLKADLNSLLGSPAYRIGKRLGLAPIPPSDPRSQK